MDKDYALNLGDGLLAGAAIGLALGILFAPASGRETRLKIRENASRFIQQARDCSARISYEGEQRITPY